MSQRSKVFAKSLGVCLSGLVVALVGAVVLYAVFLGDYPRNHVEAAAARPPSMLQTTVHRIFMHEPNRYSFFTAEDNSTELITLTIVNKDDSYNYVNPRIFADVPPGKSAWIRAKMPKPDLYIDLEIHIHSVKEINGAGWERQAGGRAKVKEQTNVVE